jgi:glycosyltransferase involved in cell wall biosynthesis
VSPVFYHGGLVTVSASSAEEIEQMLGIRRVQVVPNGISDFFSPGGEKSPTPLVVAAGRLVSVKAFEELIGQFVRVREKVPEATFVIAGEGYLRDQLESQVEELGAGAFVSLPGRVTDEELRDLYRRAWIVTSSSHREGWGMSLTEAAACGTPAVAVDIAGHRDSIHNGVSGVLAPRGEALGDAMVEVLTDPAQLAALTAGALEVASEMSWDQSALELFRLLADRAR